MYMWWAGFKYLDLFYEIKYRDNALLDTDKTSPDKTSPGQNITRTKCPVGHTITQEIKVTWRKTSLALTHLLLELSVGTYMYCIFNYKYISMQIQYIYTDMCLHKGIYVYIFYKSCYRGSDQIYRLKITTAHLCTVRTLTVRQTSM